MHNWKILKPEQLAARRKLYPAGTRVELIAMDDPYTSLKAGATGTITGVDCIGDIEMNWDSGSTLKLIYGVDRFRIIR